MSTTPKSNRTTPRVRAQKIRLSGYTQKLKFGGWLNGRHTYLRVEDPTNGITDWVEGYALYRFAKAVVRRWENQR